MSDHDDLLDRAKGHIAYINREPTEWWDDEHCLDNGRSAVIVSRLADALRAEVARAVTAETALVAVRAAGWAAIEHHRDCDDDIGECAVCADADHALFLLLDIPDQPNPTDPTEDNR